MMQLVGSPVSPFVRKVIAVLKIKGPAFEIDPVTAFYTDDAFLKLNPLRRIPVLIDGETVVADSTVICEYLEDRYPELPVFPLAPSDRAKARWLNEYAGSYMTDVFLWQGFGAVVVRPGLFGAERDLDAFKQTLAGPVAEIMDYLETLAPEDEFVCGEISVADLAIAVMFQNMKWARWTPDPARWPKTAAWIERCDAHPSLTECTSWGDSLVRMMPPKQRDALKALGGPVVDLDLTPKDAPERGPMTRI